MAKKRLRIGRRTKLRGVKTLGKLNKEVKTLKKFVMKTIENKQINWSQTSNVNDLGFYSNQFIRVNQGAADGSDMVPASNARIGNSITLMRQNFKIRLSRNSSGDSAIPQNVRLLVVESVEGNTALDLNDVLWYWQNEGGAASGDDLETFVSGYTTKADTNKRYKIHKDIKVDLGLYTRTERYINCDIRYGKTGKVVTFDGDDDSIPNNHRITVMAVSNQSVASRIPYLTMHVRSTYKDA